MSRTAFLLVLCLGISSALEGSGEDGDPLDVVIGSVNSSDTLDVVVGSVNTLIVPCPEPTQSAPCPEPTQLEPCAEPTEQLPCAEPTQSEPCAELVKLEPCSESVQENPCPILAIEEPRPEVAFEGGAIRRWNDEDLVREYQKKEDKDKRPYWISEPITDDVCPHGWAAFRESCYLIEPKMTTMDKAERQCRQLDTTLFVANTAEEWNFINALSMKNQFTWIGIFKEDETVPDNKLWQTNGGLDLKSLNWLLGSDKTGWDAKSRCAAVFNHDDYNYVHFYPCSYSYNFICERNATLYY